MSSLVADTATNENVKAAAIQNEKEVFEILTDAQKAKIPELKAKLSEEHLKRWPVAGQDMTLYRFLEARAFDVEKAAEMLLNHLEWRKETYPIKKEEWVNDPFFKAGAVVPNAGFDNGGRPLLVLKSGRFPVNDDSGEKFKYGRRDLDKVLRGFLAMFTEQANTYGLHSRFTVIYDRQDFVKARNLDLDLLKAVAKILSDNSPESLQFAGLYPCGFILRGLWMIVQWFFDAKTRAKIFMLGSPDGFADYIPMDQISVDMGGEKDFVWKHNDEEMWKKTFDAYPDVTVDNWQDPNWKDTQINS
jgi:hypothetical protein